MKKTLSMILALVMMLGILCIGISAEQEPLTLDMQMADGASIRVGTVGGIRFQTMINKAQLDALVNKNGAENVKIGTVIAPTKYVEDAGAFTMAALDAFKTEKGLENDAYVNVPATYSAPYGTKTVEGTEYYVFAGSLENIKDANKTLAFSGVGYVQVGDEIVYATRNWTNSRSIGYVAYRAYLDAKSGLTADEKGLIANFANAFLTETLGEGAPDISLVRYFETYDDMADTAEFADAPTFLGWKDNFFYEGTVANQPTKYVYGKDVRAKYENGKLIFQTTNGSRPGYTSEEDFKSSNGKFINTQDGLHALLTIPGLNSAELFADGNDTVVLQFKVRVTDFKSDCAIGISAVDRKNHNFGRGNFISVTKMCWTFCTETKETSSWHKNIYHIVDKNNAGDTTGAVPAEFYDLTGDEFVTYQFSFRKDMNTTLQIVTVNGHAMNRIIAGANQFSDDFDIGLYIFKEGTLEVDDLLVYSYNSAENK